MSPTVLWSSILALDLGGLALGAALLWGGPSVRHAGWGRDARVFVGLGLGLAGVCAAIGAASGLGQGFLVLRLACHALFCVLLPLLLVRALQRRGRAGLALAALALAAEGAYVWAREVEPYRLEVTHRSLESPRLAAPLRIAVLADLQTDDVGPFEARVFAALDEERVDLVLVPGDLLQLAWDRRDRAREERARLTALFDGLQHRPRLGFLMVGGDCEPYGVGLDEAGVRLLQDEAVVFAAERLQVIGLTSGRSRHALDERLAAAARAFDGLTIVLGHAPDFSLYAAEIGAPVVCIAGHTHGGQVQLPFFGPPITLSHVPRRMAAGGLFALGDSWLCVSRGIGMERGSAPQIRFLCRPELPVLDLVPAGTTAAASPALAGRAARAR